MIISILPFSPYYEYETISSNNFTKINGTWIVGYTDNKNFIRKQFHNLESKKFPCYSKICCNYLKNLTILNQLYWAICMIGQWKSIIRREYHCKKCIYLTKTYDLNHKDLSWSEEYCDYSLNTKTAPIDIKYQLNSLNEYLKKNNLYLVDLHSLNVRVKNNKIKIIDGELLNQFETSICQILYPIITGTRMKSYKDYSNILWSNENRCPLDAIWNKKIRNNHNCILPFSSKAKNVSRYERY